MLTSSYAGAPFAGGAVGFLSYGAAKWFEPVLGPMTSEVDDALFLLFRTVLAFDHVKQVVEIRTVAFTDAVSTDAALRRLYHESLSELDRIAQALAAPLSLDAPNGGGNHQREFDLSNFSRADFEQAVRDIKELIAAGECYQTVLSQRFSRPVTVDAVSYYYRALRRTNPSPYMYLLQFGKDALIGASPEMLVRCTGCAWNTGHQPAPCTVVAATPSQPPRRGHAGRRKGARRTPHAGVSDATVLDASPSTAPSTSTG